MGALVERYSSGLPSTAYKALQADRQGQAAAGQRSIVALCSGQCRRSGGSTRQGTPTSPKGAPSPSLPTHNPLPCRFALTGRSGR